MIKKGKINPLEVFGIRRVNYCPSYFESAKLKMQYNLNNAITQWVEDNLSGRYYIGQTVVLNEENGIEVRLKLAFEKESELSYFMLACPHLKYK